jgi:hypothetical protein
MRRLTPVLLTSLLCSASAFAVEDVATESRASTNARKKLAAAESRAEVPQSALFHQLIGSGTCATNSLTKTESQGAIEAKCTMAGSSAAKLCRRLGLQTRKVRTRNHSARRLIFTTSSVSAGRLCGYIRRKA